jgi:biotin synthase
MGEGDEDVVDLAFALRELGVDSLPLNFLLSIDGTPLADAGQVSATRALKALCLMRFTNPASDIRAAGGRERSLGGWQGLALYPANSVFIEGYPRSGARDATDAALGRVDGFVVEGEVEVMDDGAAAPRTRGYPAATRSTVDHSATHAGFACPPLRSETDRDAPAAAVGS